MFEINSQSISLRAVRPAHHAGPDLRKPRVWRAPDGGDGAAGSGAGQGTGQDQSAGRQQGGGQESGGTPEATWETWLAGLPEADRATVTRLHEAHTQGLRTALDRERVGRADLEKQLRAASDKLKDGDELKGQLTRFADDMAEANRRADFFQEVAKPEVGLADPEAAWILVNAKADEFFDRKGNLNLALLRQRHPFLFQQTLTPRGNAGAGGGQGGGGKTDFNSLIRVARNR